MVAKLTGSAGRAPSASRGCGAWRGCGPTAAAGSQRSYAPGTSEGGSWKREDWKQEAVANTGASVEVDAERLWIWGCRP